jgi:hypothetical protein
MLKGRIKPLHVAPELALVLSTERLSLVDYTHAYNALFKANR